MDLQFDLNYVEKYIEHYIQIRILSMYRQLKTM
jgi:hypothetical protein